MARRLTLVERPTTNGAADPLRALAAALAPYLRELLGEQCGDADLVDVVATVPAPRRTVMRACRSGAIAGAARVGRRWLAPRASVDAFLRARGPRVVEPDEDEGDELEALRQRIGGRR